MVPVTQASVAGALKLSDKLFSGFSNMLLIWILHELCARELGQDAEGAGLGYARARLPVLRILNQPLFAGVIGQAGWGAH